MLGKFMFGENRSAFLFMLGLAGAAGLSIALDSGGRYLAGRGGIAILAAQGQEMEVVSPRPLTASDRRAAEVAWAYIAANTRPETGLVDSVGGYPSTTMWDQGSYLLALMSAHRIGLVEAAEFDRRMGQALHSLGALPLFEGKLPNKAYDTRTLAMVDYQNNVVDGGVGWSALDIARVLSALRAIERSAPQYGHSIRKIVAGWDLSAMADEGQLTGAVREKGETGYPQEGRIGYEQYAARAAALWGLDVLSVISARPILEWKEISGIDVPIDRRTHSAFQAITPVLSEPFILQGLELGLDTEGALMASRVYRAQEARFRQTGQPTMVSEDHVDQEPYFLYSTVHANGQPWAVVSESGAHHEELRTISVKTVFAWDALYQTDYTARMREIVTPLADPGRGWPAGVYEESGKTNETFTLNTNAIVLEAVHFMSLGPLWQAN